MKPWTRRLTVSWRPTVTYFERRFEVLRSFEDRGLLRQFRVDDDEVMLRVGDPRHVLVLRPTGLVLSALQPEADVERVNLMLEEAWRLAPPHIGRLSATFQWVLSSDLAYDAARSEAARVLLGTSSVGAYTDFAVVMDGRFDTPDGDYHVEMGVVSAAEVGPRLSRAVGRAGPQDRAVPAELWPVDAVPETSYFCDLTWRSRETQGDVGLDEVRISWTNTEDAATKVASELLGRIGVERQ